MIEARHASIIYPDGTIAVRDATIQSPPSSITILAGPNGGGKTSLLLAIRGIIPRIVKARVEGELRVYGLDPRRDWDRVSLILQGTLQDPKVQVLGPTVLAEAALSLVLRGRPRSEVVARASRALRAVGLEGLEHRPTHRLSTGQLARTALAGALTSAPRHLVLDEPTSFIDEQATTLLLGILRELASKGVGILAATHDPRLWEEADNCYTLEHGVSRPGCPKPPEPPRPGARSRRGTRLLAQAEEVWARYPGSGDWALRGASVRVHAGELVALYGPNGGGKTSLLLVLAGLLEASRGRVRVLEAPALLPPDPLLVFHKGTLREQAGGKVPPWAEGVADKPLYRASGGERRVAALAAVVATGKRLLLLDEPTDWLDPWWRARVTRLLAGLAGEGYGIVVATHDKGLLQAADRVYRVEGGVSWEE